MKPKLYVTKTDLKGWNKIDKKPLKQIVKELDSCVLDNVDSNRLYQSLKKKVGLSYEIPESYTMEEHIDFGDIKEELVRVKIQSRRKIGDVM